MHVPGLLYCIGSVLLMIATAMTAPPAPIAACFYAASACFFIGTVAGWPEHLRPCAPFWRHDWTPWRYAPASKYPIEKLRKCKRCKKTSERYIPDGH